MRFALTQKALTFSLAFVAALPLVLSGEIGLEFEIAFFVFWSIGWFVEAPLTRRPHYRRVITAVLLLILGVQLARLVAGGHMARLGMEFIVIFLSIKLISRGYAFDYYQIVILSFLHIIAATVAIDDLLYGICFVLLVGLSSPVLALSYLRQEMEQRFSPNDDDPNGSEMLARLFRSKRIVSSGFVLMSSLLSVPILVITVLLFLLFPRFGFGFLGRLSNDEVEIGFGDQVTLGDFDIVRMEDTVLIRMEPIGGKGALPDRLDVKLRGAVFDHYENNTWKKSRKLEWEEFPMSNRLYLLNRVGLRRETPLFDILLEPIEPNLLFVPDGTGAIRTFPVVQRQRVSLRTLEKNTHGEVKYLNDTEVGIRYQVAISGAPPYGEPPSQSLSYLSLPKNSERIETLARQFASSGTNSEKAHQLVAALMQNYKYSLSLSDDERNVEEDDPLSRFLYSRKTGTCEHFATALTLMLRVHGIPARLVTGFLGAEWNSLGRFYSVRKRSAHSWTEAYIDGQWISLDATPASTDIGTMASPSSYSLFLDAVRMHWHKYIVGYDLGLQGEIAFGAWRLLRGTPLRFSSANTVPWAIIVLLVVVIPGGILLRRYLLKSTGTTARGEPVQRIQRRAQKEATKVYTALENKLSKLGYPRPPERTPTEHIQHISATVPFSLKIAEEITARYLQVRFGKIAFKRGEKRDLQARIKNIGRN